MEGKTHSEFEGSGLSATHGNISERIKVSCLLSDDLGLSNFFNRLGVAGAVLQSPLSFTD